MPRFIRRRRRFGVVARIRPAVPAKTSLLLRWLIFAAHPVGHLQKSERGANNSSLLLPLAAVAVVATRPEGAGPAGQTVRLPFQLHGPQHVQLPRHQRLGSQQVTARLKLSRHGRLSAAQKALGVRRACGCRGMSLPVSIKLRRGRKRREQKPVPQQLRGTGFLGQSGAGAGVRRRSRSPA